MPRLLGVLLVLAMHTGPVENCTKKNHHNTTSNAKGVELHICKALLTLDGENKGGFWWRQDV